MKIFALYVRLMETAGFFTREDLIGAASDDHRISTAHFIQLLELARQMNRRDDAREATDA